MSTNKVDYIRDEVTSAKQDWQKVDDVVAGERAIKAAGDTYLPRPNPTDESAENLARYDQYVDRAVFFNATGRTLEGLLGIAFKKGAEIVVPKNMEFIFKDLDGAGGSIHNQAHRVLEEQLKKARGGLLADYPATAAATSQADQVKNKIHANITLYPAESIINWRLDEKQDLSLVVLYETVDVDDGYAVEQVEQWRELRIGIPESEESNMSERYIVRLWRRSTDEKKASEIILHKEYTPKDANGQFWTEIPFQFFGAIDNNPDIDKSPLIDLACLNIAHYRNSADYEESVYFTGQPTFAASGLTDEWIDHAWKDRTFYVGARSLIPLPVGGQIIIAQASPNTLAGEAMKKKEDQMVNLGARLLMADSAIKTAEQSRSDTAASHSVLSLAAENMSLAYDKALGWVDKFTNRKFAGEGYFTMPTDYVALLADPNLINAIVAGWQQGAIPTSDKNTSLKALGIINPDKDDQEIEDEINSDNEGLGLDLNGGDTEQQPPADGEVAPEE